MTVRFPLRQIAAALVLLSALAPAALAEELPAPPLPVEEPVPPPPAPPLPVPPAPRLAPASRAVAGGRNQRLTPLAPGIESEWRAQHASEGAYFGFGSTLLLVRRASPDGAVGHGLGYRVVGELALAGGIGVSVGYTPDPELPIVLDFMPLTFAVKGIEFGAGIGLQSWFVRGCVGLDAPWNPLRHLLGNLGVDLLYNGRGDFGLGLSLRVH